MLRARWTPSLTHLFPMQPASRLPSRPSATPRLRHTPATHLVRADVRNLPPAVDNSSLPRCARILYMTTLSLAEARANLSKLVESAVTTHERFEVTRNGDRVAVLLGADDYDSLLETLDILSNPDEVTAIQAGLAEIEAGEVVTADEVRAALAAREK